MRVNKLSVVRTSVYFCDVDSTSNTKAPPNKTPNRLISGSYSSGKYKWPIATFDFPNVKKRVSYRGAVKTKKKGVWVFTEREIEYFHKLSGSYPVPTDKQFFAGFFRREGTLVFESAQQESGNYSFVFIVGANGNWHNFHVQLGLHRLFGSVGTLSVGSPKTEGSGVQYNCRNAELIRSHIIPVLDQMPQHGIKAKQYRHFKKRVFHYLEGQRAKPAPIGIVQYPLSTAYQESLLSLVDEYKSINFYIDENYYKSNNLNSLPIMDPQFISGFCHGDFTLGKKVSGNSFYFKVKITQAAYNSFLLLHMAYSFHKLYGVPFSNPQFSVYPKNVFSNQDDRSVLEKNLKAYKNTEIGIEFASFEAGMLWIKHLNQYPTARACEKELLAVVQRAYKLRDYAEKNNHYRPLAFFMETFREYLSKHKRPISTRIRL